jgi:hypothetical protein
MDPKKSKSLAPLIQNKGDVLTEKQLLITAYATYVIHELKI